MIDYVAFALSMLALAVSLWSTLVTHRTYKRVREECERLERVVGR